MPPKQQQQKGNTPSTPNKGAAKPVSAKTEPVYPKMGRKRVEFIASAREFSGLLTRTYGEGFSISQFEKSLTELRGKTSLKDLIHLPDELLSLHASYVVAKEAMVEESSLLKKSFLSVPIVAAEITTADQLFAEKKEETPKKTGEGATKAAPSGAN